MASGSASDGSPSGWDNIAGHDRRTGHTGTQPQPRAPHGNMVDHLIHIPHPSAPTEDDERQPAAQGPTAPPPTGQPSATTHRTRPTARKSTGGKAPREHLTAQAARRSSAAFRQDLSPTTGEQGPQPEDIEPQESTDTSEEEREVMCLCFSLLSNTC